MPAQASVSEGTKPWPAGSGRPIAVALSASAAVVMGSPEIGALRAAVFSAFPDEYRHVMAGTVVTLVVILVIACALRIRDRRIVRYGWLSASVMLGVTVSRLAQSGNANVDAVEAFHFVEYGVLTLLFYRVWHAARNVSTWVAPVLAAMAVAICDEWLQWFIPQRAGEMRDVWLNGAAAVCGLLFSTALMPVERTRPAGPDVWRRMGMAGVAVVVLGAGFFSTAHLGYEISDPEIGVFASIDSAEVLLDRGRGRQARWRVQPPLTLSRLGREDQYLSEALWHVRRRNDAYADGDMTVAWNENRILETFYAPVLDVPTYADQSGHRWPIAQQREAEARRVRSVAFRSDAHPYPIYAWPKWAFWMVVGVGCAVTFWLARTRDRRP